MNSSYKGLQLLSTVFTWVAWAVLAIGIIGAVGVVLGNTPGTPRAVGLVVLAVGGLYCCLLHALSGIIRLLLAIEEQTRKPSV